MTAGGRQYYDGGDEIYTYVLDFDRISGGHTTVASPRPPERGHMLRLNGVISVSLSERLPEGTEHAEGGIQHGVFLAQSAVIYGGIKRICRVHLARCAPEAETAH